LNQYICLGCWQGGGAGGAEVYCCVGLDIRTLQKFNKIDESMIVDDRVDMFGIEPVVYLLVMFFSTWLHSLNPFVNISLIFIDTISVFCDAQSKAGGNCREEAYRVPFLCPGTCV